MRKLIKIYLYHIFIFIYLNIFIYLYSNLFNEKSIISSQ